MNEEGKTFVLGVLTGLVMLGLFLLLCGGALRGAAEEALVTHEISYMLYDRVEKSSAILFATDEGRIIYCDGSLFKEME